MKAPANRVLMAGTLTALGVLAAATSAPALAASPSNNQGHLGLLVSGDLEYGGDNVVTVFFTNGSSQKIRAGQGASLGIGAHYRPAASPWDFSATLGSKFVLNASNNSDLKITRMVFKLAGTYQFDNGAWLAAGPVMHTSTKLDGDSLVQDIKFKNATGAMVGVGWQWVGLTYTNMKYKGQFPGSVDASSFGLTLAWKQ
jgi:hypothetical protein